MRSGAGENCLVASYSINQVGIEHARELIAKSQYVLRSEWGTCNRALRQKMHIWNATAGRSTRGGFSA